MNIGQSGMRLKGWGCSLNKLDDAGLAHTLSAIFKLQGGAAGRRDELELLLKAVSCASFQLRKCSKAYAMARTVGSLNVAHSLMRLWNVRNMNCAHSTKSGMFSSFLKPPRSSNQVGWVKWCRVTLGSKPSSSIVSRMSWNLGVEGAVRQVHQMMRMNLIWRVIRGYPINLKF
eukprot:1142431-Pelagomonas_calceolata.AAC.12